MSPAIFRQLQTPQRSFFLFGPRGAGKSTWLKHILPKAVTINLLDTKTYLELSRHPENLAFMIGPLQKNKWIILDEIQKIPQLLDEVHKLIESHGCHFALTGSSARKLKRGNVNLLGGRALTRYLEPFSAYELKHKFDLDRALQWGGLPLVYLHPNEAQDLLNTYVHTYLKEEIREEGIIRKVEPFIRFLEISGLMNGQQINYENISSQAQIPRSTAISYFSILQDTLLGHFLWGFKTKAKVREVTHPKFYWFDPGVARAASGLLYDAVDSVWLGFALETWIYHELRVYNSVRAKHRNFYFYRTSTGSEIDFIVETQKGTINKKPQVICIEVKSATRWERKWEKPMHQFSSTNTVNVNGMFGIYRGTKEYHFDGVHVLPVNRFLELLYSGKIF